MSDMDKMLCEVREELERMNSKGKLAVWEMADDRGLEIEEYVELFKHVLSKLDIPPKPT